MYKLVLQAREWVWLARLCTCMCMYVCIHVHVYMCILGTVILKNENVLEDMIDILLKIHEYIPFESNKVVDEQTQHIVAADLLHRVLFGGDQLT